MIILVNFEILGEMPIGSGNDAVAPVQQNQPQPQSKPVQNNENIEPNKPSVQTKAFYNNASTKESQTAHKPTPLAASNQTQMFNSFKIMGISGLNPYQNK